MSLILQISLKLTKVEPEKKKETVEQPVLDVIIGSMKTNIVVRKWDTQGTVSIKEVAILDYITIGTCIFVANIDIYDWI